jgi:hypothetical protein
MVPTWKEEFDALVTETMAFAASVNEKKLAQSQSKHDDQLVADATVSEGDAKVEIVQAGLPVLATVEAVLAEEPTAPSPLPEAPSPSTEPTTWPARLSPMTVPPFEQRRDQATAGKLQGSQLRMQTEREEFYVQTMARSRAVIERSPASMKMKRGTV